MKTARMKLTFLLWVLPKMFSVMSTLNSAFKKRIKEKNFTAQIKTKDGIGRWYTFKEGKVKSGAGINPAAEVAVTYHDAETALMTMQTKIDVHRQINEMKEYKIDIAGPDELSSWFIQTCTMLVSLMGGKTSYGTYMGNSIWRYTSGTNGGPVFVYVKEGKIIRITPIEFDDTDAKPWSIFARGKNFTPPRKTTLAPYSYSWKSLVYSPDRLLYPMKRVDFDPNGERNCENRGTSKYVRISWDEALDIVANEIKRV
ncbi:MAG: molybdopterin-dependent oxidoreductase, partial [Leptospirales bacterium]|nr:molybdopterin-dependent oxidoreductase [Leptospirales bacterium]